MAEILPTDMVECLDPPLNLPVSWLQAALIRFYSWRGARDVSYDSQANLVLPFLTSCETNSVRFYSFFPKLS